MAFTVGTEACTASLTWTGVEGSFVPGFPALDPSHLVVTYQPNSGVSVTLTAGVHYSAAIDGAGAVTVTPIAMPAAPGVVTIDRKTPATQTTNFINLGSFSPDIHTQLHDQAVMAIAEVRRDLSRAALGAAAALLSITLTPAPATRGLVINQFLSGTVNMPPLIQGLPLLAGNGIAVATDTEKAGATFVVDFGIVHNFGGGNGGRQPILVWQRQTSAMLAGSLNRNYCAIEGLTTTLSGDGGTGLSLANSLGAYFGGDFQYRIGPLATNVFNACGIEVDCLIAPGASLFYNWGVSIVSTHAVQGASLDAGLVFYSTGASTNSDGTFGPGGGFHQVISFAETAVQGLPPCDAGATLIGTHLETLGSFAAATGIDFTKFVFSGNAFQSNKFQVTQAGAGAFGLAAGGLSAILEVTQNAGALPADAGVTARFSGADGGTPIVDIDSFGGAGGYRFRRADGTAAARTALAAADIIGQMSALGYDGAAMSAGAAAIRFTAFASAANWTGADHGCGIFFMATPTGTVALAEAGRFSPSGGFSVGTPSDPGIGAIFVNNANFMIRTATSFANGAAAGAGTLTNAPAAGNPTKWISIDDNGTTRKIPAW